MNFVFGNADWPLVVVAMVLNSFPFAAVLYLCLSVRRIHRLSAYRLGMLAFADFGATPNEKFARLLWAMNQPRWQAMMKHKGEWDDMLVGHYAPDFIAWRQINL